MYWEYMECIGLLPCFIIAAAMVVGQGIFIWSQYWLATWANTSAANQKQDRSARNLPPLSEPATRC